MLMHVLPRSTAGLHHRTNTQTRQPASQPATSRLVETQYGPSAPTGNIYESKGLNSHWQVECRLPLSPLRKCTRFQNTQSVSVKIILPLRVTLLVSRVMTCDTGGDNACFPTVRMGWIATSLSLSPPPHPFSSKLPVSLWVFWSPSTILRIYLLTSVSVATRPPAHLTACLPSPLSVSVPGSQAQSPFPHLLSLPPLWHGPCPIHGSLPLLCPHRQYCLITRNHIHEQVPP